MRVRVTDLCQGHARCIVFAPETFEIDEEGFAFVQPGREQVADEHRAAVRRACDNCPEGAIAIDES